jgi:HPt (histidine-containing phosphotransfer) domain-containing protein
MATSSALTAALDRLWIKFQPEMEQRIAVLEAAAQALTTNSLSEQQRETAHAAAHKLAGSLGTFGLHRGTELARQTELLLAQEVKSSESVPLQASVTELRQIFESRKTL